MAHLLKHSILGRKSGTHDRFGSWGSCISYTDTSTMSESRNKDITLARCKEVMTSSLTLHTTPPHPERRAESHLATVTGGVQWSGPLA